MRMIRLVNVFVTILIYINTYALISILSTLWVVMNLWKFWNFIFAWIHHMDENSVDTNQLASSEVGLPRLRNLVNVYRSSSNQKYSLYTNLPD